MNDAAAKIKMINASLRCFTFGLLAILPIIGIAFGIAALILSARVRRQQKQLWNVARPYAVWGSICALWGILNWTFVIVVIICNAF
jgi:hypothetical protein